MSSPIDKTRKLPLAVVAAFCLLPALQTAAAVHWQIASAVTYPALKLLMIAAPLLAWRWTRRARLEVSVLAGLKRTRLLGGLATGLLAAGVILGGYYFVLAANNPDDMKDLAKSFYALKEIPRVPVILE